MERQRLHRLGRRPVGKNFLNGGDGNDTLRASGGQDFFDGGDDLDTVSYDPETEVEFGVRIDLGRTLQDNDGSGSTASATSRTSTAPVRTTSCAATKTPTPCSAASATTS